MARLRKPDEKVLKLKYLRIQKGWNQDALAKKVGLSKATIVLMESGKQIPTFSQAKHFAALLGEPNPETILQQGILKTEFYVISEKVVAFRVPIKERRLQNKLAQNKIDMLMEEAELEAS